MNPNYNLYNDTKGSDEKTSNNLNFAYNPEDNKPGIQKNKMNLRELDTKSSIGVSVSGNNWDENPSVEFTKGMQNNKALRDCFFSDSEALLAGNGYGMGEELLGVPVTVSFTCDDLATGTMDPVRVATNVLYTLPEHGFEILVPSLTVFDGWKTQEASYYRAPGFEILVKEDTVVNACFSGKPIPYIDRSEGEKILYAKDYTIVTSSTGDVDFSDGGTYIVSGEVTIDGRINVNGDVKLVLCDDAKLTVSKGVHVSNGKTIRIFGQSGDNGVLNTTGDVACAGIGGGPNESNGTVIIHGGTIKATGGPHEDFGAAGIGGGNSGSGGTITIHGGNITATGGASQYKNYGQGGNITINGGTVTASGDSGGAGIGGGDTGEAGKVIINGGTITAESNGFGAGIGMGADGDEYADYDTYSIIRINGGQITASSIEGDNSGRAINLSWTDPTDFIEADFYYGGTTIDKDFYINDGPDILKAGSFIRNYSDDYPKLTPALEKHTVTFDSSGAAEVPAQKVPHGYTAQKPEDPEAPEEGTVFAGWYQVVDGKMKVIEFDFSTPITEDITLKAFFGPDQGGAEEFRIITQGDAPEIDSANLGRIAEVILAEEEIDNNIGLLLVSTPLSAGEVPAADKKVLTDTAGGLDATPGIWFDISLYKLMNVWMGFSPDRLNEDTTVKLTKVPEGVKLTAEVPESLRKEGRTYYLLACHNGTVTVVAQGTGTTLSWETDEFSTYLIAYRDASGSGSKKSSSGSGSTKKSGSPGTGDESQMMLWTLLLIASAGGLAVMLSKKKRWYKGH